MNFSVTVEDRNRFKRCRRQWDFASPHRGNLEPVGLHSPALPTALEDALAVYYYPGTWDWPHELTQSLVHKALTRSLEDSGEKDQENAGLAVLDCYDAWASTIDDFAPVRIGCDLQVLVPDPRDPARGLIAPDGSPVVYSCRVDLLAVDAADEYWVVCHRIVYEWADTEMLIRDEDAVAVCWAWEQDYPGMEIAGTIHNEVRLGAPLQMPSVPAAAHGAHKAVAQHEPSGGGRSIPVHRRASARARHWVVNETRVEQRTAGMLRRTRIRRGRAEITAVAVLIGAEARDMITGPAIYPTPAAHCRQCAFSAPCLALVVGLDPKSLLDKQFRQRSTGAPTKPRLGQATWGFGRGAAPPRW